MVGYQTSQALTAHEIAKLIDHAVLRPEMNEAEVQVECELARQYHAATACVRPYDVALAKRLLAGSDVLVSVVIGFPHGIQTPAVKALEARQAIDAGAVELDMVLPIGRLRSGDWDYVEQDIANVLEVAHPLGALVKVIFENCYLTSQEIIRACQICDKLGADFVKTSTGFGTGGAKLEDVRLMRRTCRPETGIKAAGGIRTLDQLLQFMAAGATRIGTRSTKEIVEEARQREQQGILVVPTV